MSTTVEPDYNEQKGLQRPNLLSRNSGSYGNREYSDIISFFNNDLEHSPHLYELYWNWYQYMDKGAFFAL